MPQEVTPPKEDDWTSPINSPYGSPRGEAVFEIEISIGDTMETLRLTHSDPAEDIIR
jgi:hypothetical protein